MNRSFPPETVHPCDHCGRDLILVVTPEGDRLEANDVRDYVSDDGPADRVVVCADCRIGQGLDDE